MTKAQRKHIRKEVEEIKLGQAAINHLVTMLDWRITMLIKYTQHISQAKK